MTHTTPPPLPTLIPEPAPFSAEQRSWLNGFLAGLLSLESGVNPVSAAESAALVTTVGAPPESPLDDGDDGQAPWHDPAMPLGERMQLADSRPLRRRMMAAMGQQDCGQCGYNCEDYANAIFGKSEERLNLCVPGGKETARMLKNLYAEFGAIPAAAKPANAPAASAEVSAPAIAKAPAPVPTHAEPAATAVPAPSRNHPAEIAFFSRTRLNKAGSSKETWHIELDLAESGITYSVGDSLGVVPANHPALVDAVIAAIG